MTATIPMPGDVAELVGSAAERVENRSLLLDKFLFHKKWPEAIKWDEASRWSFMRIADGAAQLLARDAAEKRRRGSGQNVQPENRDRYLGEAKIAETLAGVHWDTRELSALRANHTRRFVGLFRNAYGDRCAIRAGQLEGRLAINLADSLIQNAGICLDRLFGLPFIPGSAVKGVSRHAALEELKNAEAAEQVAIFDQFRAVFGTADNDFEKGDLCPFRLLLKGRSENLKGCVSFLPVYPINEARLVVDLTNVHYPDYYRTRRTEDLSKEKPRPNPFPAVEIGAQFAFCLVLNGMNDDRRLLASATRWLELALTVRGLGAKTGAGYGWFSMQPQVLEAMEDEDRKERERAEAAAEIERKKRAEQEAEAKRLSELAPEAAAAEKLLKLTDEQFANFAKELPQKDETDQRAFIDLLTTNKEKRDRWKTWKRKKPEIAKVIDSVRSARSLSPLP